MGEDGKGWTDGQTRPGMGGTGLGDLGWIQTPIPSWVSLTQAAQICVSNSTGVNLISPIGVSATQHGVRGN